MSHSPDRRSVLAGLAALPILAATPLAAEPVQRPFNLRMVMSGHSLTDPIPRPLEILVKAAGGAQSRGMLIDKSTIPGSPAEMRWLSKEPADMHLGSAAVHPAIRFHGDGVAYPDRRLILPLARFLLFEHWKRPLSDSIRHRPLLRDDVTQPK